MLKKLSYLTRFFLNQEFLTVSTTTIMIHATAISIVIPHFHHNQRQHSYHKLRGTMTNLYHFSKGFQNF